MQQKRRTGRLALGITFLLALIITVYVGTPDLQSVLHDSITTFSVYSVRPDVSGSSPTWPREARICDETRCTGVRRVVAFSVFGLGANMYSTGVVENARLMRGLMPDWECWVYTPGAGEVRHRLDKSIRAALDKAGARVVLYSASERKTFSQGVMKRFLVAGDPDVDRFIVRDADARLLLRDREAEDDFEASGRRFHVIYDHWVSWG